MKMNQHIIDRAVAIATKAALSGRPVDRIVWVPPETAAGPPDGSFVVINNSTGPSRDGHERDIRRR